MRPRLPARQTHDYRRNGLTSLYAALEVASGRVLGECRPRQTGADFLAFLKRLARAYRGRELRVVVDNSSTHSTPAVLVWLQAHPMVQLHFTPKGASWLNMIDAWCGILTRKSVRRGSFETVRALIRHIDQYIAHWNDHSTPFVWTKTPADIIVKAVRRDRHAVIAVVSLNGEAESEILATVAAVERDSEHRVASAVVAEARVRGLTGRRPRWIRRDPRRGSAGARRGARGRVRKPAAHGAVHGPGRVQGGRPSPNA